jgi:3-oxoacyl-[acyl-carrier-protein] synthase-3
MVAHYQLPSINNGDIMFKIIGTGSYLPERKMTNKDLEKIVDTTDEWISERTGIHSRRIAADNELNSDMATRAAERALQQADMKPNELELIITGTSTADYTLPAMAPIVQHNLGCGHIPAFDLNSVCTSFAYSFITATGFLNSGYYRNCLIIGSDLYSRILNWQDRTTCCIFGDGAGAVVIEQDPTSRGIISHIYGADGSDSELIKVPVGGTKYPAYSNEHYQAEDYFFQMQGTHVYEFTITTIPQVARELIEQAELTNEDIDWVVLHQANRRIIESVSRRTKIPLDRFIINIDKYGNTSSASIPIALDEGFREGKITKGDTVMILGFGGGLSWGGAIFEW